MKKVLCLLLCMIMLLGVLVACGGTDDPNADPAVTTTQAPGGNEGTGGDTTGSGSGNNGTTANGGTTTNGGTTATQPAGTKYPKHTAYDFGDSLGNARVFNFLARNNRWKYLHGTEESTNTVTKAAYKRNMILNEMYNIEIMVTNSAGGSNAQQEASFNTLLAASTGEYDIAIPDVWWGLEYAGYFVNLMTVPEINEADPYWVQGWNDNMIINNRMYTIAGDAALEMYENIEVVFYNRAIEDEYDYDLYQTVKDGKWTLDEMIYTIDVFTDALTDNDADNDVYGVHYNVHSLRSSFYCAGIKMLQTNRNNGIITVIADTARNINASDKIAEVMHHTATIFDYHKTARAVSIDQFVQSKVFMFAGCLYRGTELKAANTVFDYGIIICPKYEESDEYTSTVYGLSTWAIPETANDVNLVATVFDTMSWLSSTEDEGGMGEDRLVYTYYNTVLKGQVSNSPRDNEMLDLARDRAYYDFGFIICYDVMLLDSFQTAVRDDVSVSTKMANMISVAESGLTDVVEFYNK